MDTDLFQSSLAPFPNDQWVVSRCNPEEKNLSYHSILDGRQVGTVDSTTFGQMRGEAALIDNQYTTHHTVLHTSQGILLNKVTVDSVV